MKINKLYLKNFRNVAEETYHFPAQFTVVIGMNGAGKSTILHALRVAAGAYFLSIPSAQAKNRHIVKDEVRMTNKKIQLPHFPVVVEASGNFPEYEEEITWRRRILSEGGSNTSSAEDVGRIRDLGKSKYDQMYEEETDELGLPVIAFFGTNRVFGTARTRSKPRTGRQIFKEGYHDWSDMRSSGYQYTRWLATYEAMVKNGKEYPESKQIFYNTIKKACPYVVEVNFSESDNSLWLSTKMHDQTSDLLPLEYQSDGIMTFVSMVAELAYRCIVLNGYLRERAVLDSKGVVLIDEIDLHLHPKWQEHVIDDLKAAFPNIQFIVTTHAPVIVQSLESNELINLDMLSDVAPNELPMGEVATHIMGLSSEYSLKSHKQELLSKEYLTLLNKKDAKNTSQKLDEIESKILNPAVRAFLQMQRLKKNNND